MGRELLFRGKRLDNDEWVSGSIIFAIHEDRAAIVHHFLNYDGKMDFIQHEVNPKTVGQFTGQVDKQGKSIFEGDTLDNGYAVQMEDGRWLARKGISVIEAEWFFNWEITGTIHDNPELL